MNTKVKASSKDLFDEVINAGLCTLCGACSGGCPYLVPYRGRIALIDNCQLLEGRCYRYCPRTYTDIDAISQQVFGEDYSGQELGTTREVLVARSAEAGIRKRAQYGGTVTALLSLAMEAGLIDSAILSRVSADRVPEPCLARSPEEVLGCAGSSYMASPVLEALNRVPKDSRDRLGMVTTPCQGLAVAKMKSDPPADRVDMSNIKLVIGLFCTWALSPGDFHGFLRANLDLSQVTRFDIPPPPANRFDAYAPSGRVSLPLEHIREFIMPACSYCLDMTSEFADISVGLVEGREGWNTVIVRTGAGAELMEMARAKGKLETDTLLPGNLAHLKEAALLKKQRALGQIIERSGDRRDRLYLGLSESLVDKLLG